MHHVYLLKSLADPKQTYIGLTDDMRARHQPVVRFKRASVTRIADRQLRHILQQVKRHLPMMIPCPP